MSYCLSLQHWLALTAACIAVLVGVVPSVWWLWLSSELQWADGNGYRITGEACFHVQLGLGGSAEDIAVDGLGRAWFSVDDRKKTHFGNPSGLPTRGGIKVMTAQSLKRQKASDRIMRVPIKNSVDLAPEAFRSHTPNAHEWLHPHGISVSPDGEYLWITNHAPTGDRLDLFRVHERGNAVFLVHTKTVEDVLLTHIKDIECINHREVYVTTWQNPYDQGALELDVFVERRQKQHVVRCRRNRVGADFFCRSVISNLVHPTGIAINLDGDRVYVVDSADMQLHVYARETDELGSSYGQLVLSHSVPTASACEQVFTNRGQMWAHHSRVRLVKMKRDLRGQTSPNQPDDAEEGSDTPPGAVVMLGCHQKPLRWLLYNWGYLDRSPSQALKLVELGLPSQEPCESSHTHASPGTRYAFTEQFFDDGSVISGMSVAALFAGKALYGSVFGTTVLVCDWTNGSTAPQ